MVLPIENDAIAGTLNEKLPVCQSAILWGDVTRSV